MEIFKFVFVSATAFGALVVFFENPYGVVLKRFEGMLWGNFTSSINKENRRSVEKLAFLLIIGTLLLPFMALTLLLTVVFDIGSGLLSDLGMAMFVLSWLMGFDNGVRGNFVFRVLRSLAGPTFKTSKEITPETELIVDYRPPIIRIIGRVSEFLLLVYLWYLVLVLANVIVV